ncbi:MAG: Holliday junction branch migration DNA helicase RuvB [Candidatus Eisenbacteria bacterium]
MPPSDGEGPWNDPHPFDSEQRWEQDLRPKGLREFVGQDQLRENLSILIEAARLRDAPLEHVLLTGPPGLGKTSLAQLLALEMDVEIRQTSGPVLEKAGDLAGLLTSLPPRGILFIDEIHRLNRTIEEYLYPAMEDFRLDILLDRGPSARSVQIRLEPFTLVGATTRAGLLSAPLRARFGMVGRVDFYPAAHLARIVDRSAGLLEVDIDAPSIDEIASRSRGTPRIANRLLRRVRDYALVRGDGRVMLGLCRDALDLLDIDERGLDEMDRRILESILDKFDGGPVGISSLAATVGEEPSTLEEVHEPYLVQQGFLQRTRLGRVATRTTYEVLGRTPPEAPSTDRPTGPTQESLL